MKKMRTYLYLLLLLNFAQIIKPVEDYSAMSTGELTKILMEFITQNNENEIYKILACPQAQNFDKHCLLKSLELAAKNNYVNIAIALIKAGATIKEQYCYALENAAENGYTTMVKILLPVLGCDKSKRQINFREVDIFNEHRDNALIRAAKNGHTDVIKELVKYGADVNNHSGYWGDVALIEATKNGHTAAVKELLQANAQVNIVNGSGQTALNIAMELCNIDVIRELLMAPGIDVSSRHIESVQRKYENSIKTTWLYTSEDRKRILKLYDLFKPFMKKA